MQIVQPFDLVELLLKIVKTYNRPGFAGLIRSDAAESHGVLNFCCCQRSRDRIADPVLLGAIVFARKIGRNHGLDGARTRESLAERLLIAEIRDEGFRTLGDDGLQTIPSPAHCSNFLTIG